MSSFIPNPKWRKTSKIINTRTITISRSIFFFVFFSRTNCKSNISVYYTLCKHFSNSECWQVSEESSTSPGKSQGYLREKYVYLNKSLVTLLFEFEFEFHIWKGSMDSFIPSGRAQLVPIVLFICNIFWKGNEILRACGSEQFLTFQLTYTWKQIESCKHLSEWLGNSNVESSKKFYCYPWV